MYKSVYLIKKNSTRALDKTTIIPRGE